MLQARMRRSMPARWGLAIVLDRTLPAAPLGIKAGGVTVDGDASLSVHVRVGWKRASRRPSAARAARPGTVAILVPHAPYESSGATAARGSAAAGTGWRRALVLGPSHFAALRGAAVLPMTAYRTPLGLVRIDQEGLAALTRCPLIRANPAVFLREHALEIQLPWLQA